MAYQHGPGRNLITIDNSADPKSETLSMGHGPNISVFDVVGMGGNWSFQSSGISNLTVNGGAGGTAFTGDFLGLTGALIALDGGTGGGSAQLTGIPVTTNVNVQAHGGNEAVLLDGGGSVSLSNPGGTTSLSIDDSSDVAPCAVILTTYTPPGSTDTEGVISGLGTGDITYDPAQMTGTISITGGYGGDTFTIVNTPGFASSSGSADFAITDTNASRSPYFVVEGTGANAVFDLSAPTISSIGGNFTFDFSGGKISSGARFNLQGAASLSIRGQYASDAFTIANPTITIGSVVIQYNTAGLLSLSTGRFSLASLDGSDLSLDGAGTSAIWGPGSVIGQLGGVSIADDARLTIASGQGQVGVDVASLAFSNGGELDVRNNTILLESSANQATTTNVRGWLAGGYDGGAWNGTGIVSTTLPPGDLLGYEASLGSGVIQPALPGDANLDGHVNLFDLLTLTRNFGRSAAGWTQGDFDYDGKVDLSDFLALTRNFGKTFAAESALASAPIQPSSAGSPTVGSADARRRLATRRDRKP